jgi:cation transporter-like permease
MIILSAGTHMHARTSTLAHAGTGEAFQELVHENTKVSVITLVYKGSLWYVFGVQQCVVVFVSMPLPFFGYLLTVQACNTILQKIE